MERLPAGTPGPIALSHLPTGGLDVEKGASQHAVPADHLSPWPGNR